MNPSGTEAVQSSQVFLVPATEAEQRELLRAGYVAVDRLWSALREIEFRGMGADVDGHLEILLEDARENAGLLFQIVTHYVPEMMGVDISLEKDEPYNGAFLKVREAFRAKEFTA